MTERAAFCGLIKSRFTPVIAVQASDDVQATCSKNGLTLVDLLRACSEGAGVGSQGEKQHMLFLKYLQVTI